MKFKIIFLFIIFELISLLYIISTGEYNSDYLHQNVKNPLYIVAIINSVIIFLYLFYYFIWESIGFLCKRLKLKNLNTPNLNILFFILSILYLFFYLRTGIGKAGSENPELSIFDKIIFIPIIISKFNFLIFIYAAANKHKSKLYYSTLVIFIFTEILRGISFPILIIGMLESKLIFDKLKKINPIIVILLFILFINIIYNLKYYARLDYSYQYIDIFTTLSMFVGRLSLTSNLNYLIEHISPISYMIESNFNYSSINEFLEKLTPAPSIFGIHEKVIEFGKLIFYFNFNHLGSATASSVLGITLIIPEQLLTISVILTISMIYCNLITRIISSSYQQNCVAFIIMFLTLYQGFWGLLANYLYAITFYLFMLIVLNLLGKKND
ncbi:oligosaccharide repeat unit polymerase [Proteus terrae]|uniref:oligosaccharide repeat unit polymerase n=1 Tax=Proteus terrae TaxID=1574161 RepID=UPI0032DBE120